jgi:hypothetical protein
MMVSHAEIRPAATAPDTQILAHAISDLDARRSHLARGR